MKKVVMIRRTGLGDFIAGMVPICNLLQKVYGEVDFYFFMNNRNAQIVKYFFPKAHIYEWTSGNRYIQAVKLALKYRKIKPDIGISPAPDSPKLNNLFLFLIGAKERYARVNQKILSNVFVNHPLKMDDKIMKTMHVGLVSLKVFDNNIKSLETKYMPKINKNIVETYSTSLKGSFIMVEVSNNRITSQLTNDKMAEILNALFGYKSFSVLITSKVDDMEKAKKLKNLLFMPSEIFVNPSIHRFIAFVNKADVVLCGDGGLGHIAGALDKKVVAVYGRTLVKRWAVLGESVIHIYDPEDVNNIDNKKIITALAKCL